MLYRIITEYKNSFLISTLIRHFFEGATIYSTIGLWRSEYEKSLVIETTACFEDVVFVAKVIRIVNKQEAVLVQKIPCQNIFV